MATLDLGKLVSESMQNLNEGSIEEGKFGDFAKKVGGGVKSGAGKAWGGVKSGAGEAWGGVKSGAGAVGRGAKSYKDTMGDQWGKGKMGKAKAIGMGAAPLLALGGTGYAAKKLYDKKKKKNQQ